MLKNLVVFAFLCSLAYSFPCDSLYEFKYPNGSCLPTCPYPYQSNWESDALFCDTPCPDSYFNIWDESCVEDCEPEFIRFEDDDILYCDQPSNNTNGCPENAQFMYYNGTCLPSCQYPFQSKWSNGSLLCVPYCEQYYYFNFWTDRCINHCDNGFSRVENDILYCDQPPQSNNTNGCPFRYDMKHPNGSCLVECPAPFMGRANGGSFFCNWPCPGRYFDTWNQSCTGICEPEYVRNEPGTELLYCDNPQPIKTKPCPYSHDLRYSNGSCLSSCSYPYKIRQKNSNYFCDAPCPGSYLNSWDGHCMIFCEDEFIQFEDGIAYCDQPNNTSNGCPHSDDFRYLNGSCLPSCHFPFKSKWSYGSLLCVPNCGSAFFNFWTERCLDTCDDDEYIRAENGMMYCDEPPKSNLANGCPFYPDVKWYNGSCSQNCPYPLQLAQNEGALYCNLPCPVGQYIYSNRSCTETCDLESFAVSVEDGMSFCLETDCTIHSHPNGSKTTNCQDFSGHCPSGYFLFDDSSCNKICPSGFYAHKNATCIFPCSLGSALYPDGRCLDTCVAGYTLRMEDSFMICDKDETYSAKIEIYLRYDIPLKDFNAGGYLAKFITMMATLLDVSDSDIKILSLREGSTIIESEVVLKSESLAGSKSKANALNQKLTEAAESKGLNLEGINVLNHKFSVVIQESGVENADAEKSSSLNSLAIGLGVGLAGVAVGIMTLVIYSRYQKKQKLLKVKTVGETPVSAEEKKRDEEICSFVHRETENMSPQTVQPETDQLSPRIKIEPDKKEKQVKNEGPMSMDEIMKNIDENL